MSQFGKVKIKTYGGAILSQRLVTSSVDVTAMQEGIYLITAIGGGGSGARGPASGTGRAATGGQAGGFVQKKTRLYKSDVIRCLIGAGGEAQSVVGGNGNNGDITYVALPSGALIAPGGGGGYTAPAGAGVVGGGGLAGTVSGGDINILGGEVGAASVVAHASSLAATGGSAVAIYGERNHSGSAVSTGGFSAATGGAGVGGCSGFAIANTINTSSAGASACAPSTNMTDGTGANIAPNNVGAANSDGHIKSRILCPGGASMTSVRCFEGAGSGGLNGGGSQPGGAFAGTGGCTAGSSGAASLGGGSGGSIGGSSGAGGNGCVIIELLGA